VSHRVNPFNPPTRGELIRILIFLAR